MPTPEPSSVRRTDSIIPMPARGGAAASRAGPRRGASRRSITRSLTGSLPPGSRERNLRHLPDAAPPLPDGDDPDLNPSTTPQPVASSSTAAPQAATGDQAATGNESDAAIVATCRRENSPLNRRLGTIEQDFPVARRDLTSLNSRLATLETDFQSHRREARDLNRENPDDNVALEAINLLRTDVNFLLEKMSTAAQQQVEQVQHQSTPALADNRPQPTDNEVDPVVAVEAATDNQAPIVAPQVPSQSAEPARAQPVRTAPRATQSASAARSTSRRTTRSSRRSTRRTSHRVKHEDSTETETSDSSDSEESTGDNAEQGEQGQQDQQPPSFGEIAFGNRRKGPKHPNLDSLVPSEERFDRLLSYRYYRLHKTNANRSSATMTRLHKTLKNLELTMREYKFSGEDPILIFDFLSRLVEEADTNSMTEGQLMVCLPHMLTKSAAKQYRAACNSSRSAGLKYWPEAVQYLLRTYATETAIREAVRDLENIRQSPTEDETAFATRINEAVYRCGNVYDDIEKIGFFINGLREETRTIVQRYRRDQPRYELSYDRIVQFARDEGDSYRARNRAPPALRPALANQQTTPRTPRRTDRTVSFVDPALSASTQDEGLYLAGDGDTDTLSSIPTSYLPSTSTGSVNQAQVEAILLAMQAQGRFRPRSPSPRRGNPGGNPVAKPPICFGCYQHGHILPECKFPISDFRKVVENYEKLTADDKARVPSTHYDIAKRFVEAKNTPAKDKTPDPNTADKDESKI